MEDFLGTALPSQLLLLMTLPLTGMILLIAFLFISFRRKKNSAMKLGIPPKPAKTKEASLDKPENQPPPPSGETLRSVWPDNQPIPTPAGDLNLGPLVSKPDRGIVMKETPPSIDQPKGNLTNRSGNRPLEPVQPAEPAELLRLLREPQSGQLIVEIGGQRYTKLADVTDKEIGQYILKLAAHLLAFTNGVIMTETGMKSLSAPKAGDVPQPIVAAFDQASSPAAKSSPAPPVEPQPVAPQTPPKVEVPSLTSLPVSPPQPAPTAKRSGFLGFGGAAQPAPPLSTLNLAGEINDIVQARLRYSPLAESHQIEITSDLSGGIRFKVNGQYYSGLDDISDAAIRDLIKTSIKEWERR